MQTTPRLRTLCVSSFTALALALVPALAFAATGDTTTLYPLTIEQETPTNMVSKWTLLSTTQQEHIGNLKTQVVQITGGQYTFFIEQPKGYATEVTLYSGDTVLKSSTNPQMAFTFAGELNARISVKYKLSLFGKVSVTSEPSGLKFVLQGPNLFKAEGVTPKLFEDMPIGQYSVQFFPDGCAPTPAKSSELKKDSRVDLSVTIKCNLAQSSSSVAAQNTSKESTQPIGPSFPFVTITSGGMFLMLRDVPLEAWFASYVKSVGEKGIMSGYKDEEGKPTDFFGPENWVTLEEMAKAVQTAVGVTASLNLSPENWYVEEWAAPYIAQAEQLDWLVYQDPHNDVTEQATRAEVVATILQAFDIPLHWPKGNVFSDVGRRTPYAAEIETAASLGIVAGRKDDAGVLTGAFDPEGWINRAEFAKILSLTLEKVGTSSSSH